MTTLRQNTDSLNHHHTLRHNGSQENTKYCRRRGRCDKVTESYSFFRLSFFSQHPATVQVCKASLLCSVSGHAWKNSMIRKNSALMMIGTGARNLWKRWLKETGVFYEKTILFPQKARHVRTYCNNGHNVHTFTSKLKIMIMTENLPPVCLVAAPM